MNIDQLQAFYRHPICSDCQKFKNMYHDCLETPKEYLAYLNTPQFYIDFLRIEESIRRSMNIHSQREGWGLMGCMFCEQIPPHEDGACPVGLKRVTTQ